MPNKINNDKKSNEDLFIKERLALLGKLTGNISHEIRNPLNVISTSAYYLKMKADTRDEKIKKRIELIDSEVKKLLEIIDALLILSGMREPHKERVGIISVINDAISDSKIQDPIKVIMDVPSDEIFISADEQQLNMTFTGIIKNALTAMKGKGKLTLRIKKIDNEKIEISIADTGSGIAQENIDKVFGPLFTTKSRGFGFGLMICKSVIEKHDGKIEIKSEMGKGTVVTLILPLALV